MELKTLKDINIIGSDGVEDSEYVKGLLKQEAIKWVKSLEADKVSEWYVGANVYLNAQISFIKKFFNLTEADLTELKGGIIDNE